MIRILSHIFAVMHDTQNALYRMFAQVSASGYLDIKFTILALICNQLVWAICVIMHVIYMSYRIAKNFRVM